MLSLWFALAVSILAFWVVVWLDRRRAFPRAALLAPADGDSTMRGDVVAIVPARDEAEVLPTTLPSLIRQTELARVVVADDSSIDATADVAREAAEQASSGVAVEVIAVPERPDGWSGKVNALQAAVTSLGNASCEWLLLSDADIRHRPGSVAGLLAKARGSGADLVSVMAKLRARSRWEKLLVPPFVFFFHLLYPFRKVADRRSGVAAAAGGCVLLRREALRRIGGFGAIRGELIDDVALARVVQSRGGGLWLGLDAGIESVRPYESLASLWSMISRNAFVQLGRRWSLVVLVVIGLALFFVLPPIGSAVGLVLAVSRSSTSWLGIAGLFGAAWCLQALLLWPWVRHHRVGWPWSLTLPVASVLYGAMTVSSALADRRGRMSSWRGRTYRPPA